MVDIPEAFSLFLFIFTMCRLVYFKKKIKCIIDSIFLHVANCCVSVYDRLFQSQVFFMVSEYQSRQIRFLSWEISVLACKCEIGWSIQIGDHATMFGWVASLCSSIFIVPVVRLSIWLYNLCFSSKDASWSKVRSVAKQVLSRSFFPLLTQIRGIYACDEK